MCECRFLSIESFEETAKTYERAFSDYFIEMRNSPATWLKGRCEKNAVSWEHSVGVFSRDRMVGFTLLGLDVWRGGRAAFDAGTGLIPEYRGRGLGPAMLESAKPKLVREGVGRLVLEVLQNNSAAIRAYRKAGFEVTREFDCFEWNGDDGLPVSSATRCVEMRPLTVNQIRSFESELDWKPSWENSLNSITRVSEENTAVGAFEEGECVGMVVHYNPLNWILSLVVKRSRRGLGIGQQLLKHLLSQPAVPSQGLRLNNVEGSDKATKGLLSRCGFEIYARQYEMELVL